MELRKTLTADKLRVPAKTLKVLGLLLIWVLCSTLAGYRPAFGSVLSDLAASMQPGTWAELTTQNIVPTLANETGASGVMTHYSNSGQWNPNNRKIYFAGADHHGGVHGYGLRLAQYDDATNTWSKIGGGPQAGCQQETSTIYDAIFATLSGFSDACVTALHGYDVLAIDVANQFLYLKPLPITTGTMRVMRSSIPPTFNSWTEMTPTSGIQFDAWYVASEFWPGKGYIVHNCNTAGGQLIIRADSGTYTIINGPFNKAPYHCAAIYSPVHNVMIFGGGNDSGQGTADNRQVWRLNADNTTTRLANTPFTAGWGVQKYNAAVDPGTGNFLFMGGNPRELWELDPRGSGTWTQLSGSRVPPSGVGDPVRGAMGVISATISGHGVIMYISCLVGKCTTYLYKHSAGSGPRTGDTTPPTISSVSASSVTSSDATITWLTDEPADTQIQYGLTTSYGSQVNVANTFVTAHSQTISGLTPSTLYHYRLRSQDPAGNVRTSGDFTLTTIASGTISPPPSGSGDFAARCAAAGVVRCWKFDKAADLGKVATPYANVGVFSNGNVTCNTSATDLCPTIDVNAPGGPAMKMVIPSQSGAASSGQWYGNISTDLLTQFGASSEFWVQLRVRYNCDFLFTDCPNPSGTNLRNFTGGGGWKIFGVETGDTTSTYYSACQALGVIWQNTNQRGFPQLYQSCIDYAPFETWPKPPNDILFQNARPNPWCRYGQGLTKPVSYFPPTGNCFPFYADEWLTLTMQVLTGPRGGPNNNKFVNSHINAWVARDGQASQQIINVTKDFWAGDVSENQRYGKLWLLTYHTGKNPSQVHPTGIAWYKELIISRQRIADPGAGSSRGSTPSAPSGLAIK